MEFWEKLILVIVENGFFALVILIIGFWINRKIEQYRFDKSRSLEITKKELEIENRLKESVINQELSYLEEQISLFYWPIYLRLQKDNIMWEKVKGLFEGPETYPKTVSENLDKNYILENHLEIVDIIQNHSHLAEDNEELFRSLLDYINHVALFRAIREIQEFSHLNPKDLGTPYPEELFLLVSKDLKSIQNRYGTLVNKYKLKVPVESKKDK